jgi:hypothetical protein
MSKEKLLEFAKNNFKQTHNETLTDATEVFNFINKTDKGLEDIRGMYNKIVCDDKDSKEARLLEFIVNTITQLHYISQDIKETLGEGENNE